MGELNWRIESANTGAIPGEFKEGYMDISFLTGKQWLSFLKSSAGLI